VPNCLNADFSRLAAQDGAVSEYGRVALVESELLYLQCDLTKPLPLADTAFDWVYSEHFIEHIPPENAAGWLSEVRRVLTLGGFVRISTPDLARYVHGYLEEDQAFFSEHAGRLTTLGLQHVPRRRAWMVNQIFHGWGHRWLYDLDEIRHVAQRAGFRADSVLQCGYRQGRDATVCNLDLPHRSDESLYVEITKTA
jgi:predicted SAM-dependent methyltransferase